MEEREESTSCDRVSDFSCLSSDFILKISNKETVLDAILENQIGD